MDIKPPPKKRPVTTPEPPLAELTPLEVVGEPPKKSQSSPRQKRKQMLTWLLAGVGVFLFAMTLSVAAWYSWALSPKSDSTKQVRVVVNAGDTATDIANNLHGHELIKSRLAFGIYTQLSGNRSKLQAGGYVLSPNQTVASIVEHMTSGKTDEFNITIPPGLTLDELRDHFKADGFSDAEVTMAFNGTYDHPLLATRPQGATLEGYIYPETYRMNADQTLEELFARTFDQMYKVLQEKGYLAEFAKRNLTIHEGIILASIVQKEVKNPADQKQVAQVFLKRLSEGMQLGSDVTYLYAAEQLGVEGTPSLDSPYNTRKYAGLPPGPIANMNPSALEAVAFPAAGDFLYFVAGDGADEGKTFFARTEAEHNANVAAHCHVLCR
jgi:UPF0755 protein